MNRHFKLCSFFILGFIIKLIGNTQKVGVEFGFRPNKYMNIGCHLSSGGGFTAMAKTAIKLGANTFQFFSRNPRGGKAKAIDPKDIESFLDIAKENNFSKIVAHAPYTLNLCSAAEHICKFSKDIFAEDLERLENIPGSLYNFHPGSHTGQGAEVGIKKITDVLNEVLNATQTTTVLLETMAGKGSEIGGKFEELRAILDNTKLKDKIGVCLDTCHVFDGGYDIVNNLEGVIEEFDKTIGIKKLKAIHINDSKNVCGSRKDRHEQIGKGNIGIKAFKKIINHKYLKDLPFILETPQEDLSGYAHEIAMLKGIYKD